jgi:hypothetical protein
MTTTTKQDWTVGQTVRLGSGFDVRDWTVKAVTDNFAALTRPVTEKDRAEDQEQAEYLGEEYELDPSEFENVGDDATVFYTVIDWRNGVRGPCDLSGGGWGAGTYTQTECAQMLAEFEAGDLEVSHRNQVPIDVVGEVR